MWSLNMPPGSRQESYIGEKKVREPITLFRICCQQMILKKHPKAEKINFINF